MTPTATERTFRGRRGNDLEERCAEQRDPSPQPGLSFPDARRGQLRADLARSVEEQARQTAQLPDETRKAG